MDRFVQNVVSRYMYSFDTFFRVSKSTVEAILWWRFNIFQNCYSEKQLMDDLKFHMKLDKFTDNAVVHRITRTNSFTVNCWSKCFWIDILSVASEGGVGVRPFINLDKQPPPPLMFHSHNRKVLDVSKNTFFINLWFGQIWCADCK